MAGTIVSDVLQDGAGNSTATTNAISGSAKAWVNFNGTTSPATIRKSYNVSSVTKGGTGDFTVNFTNPLVDANYAIGGMTGDGNGYSIAAASGSTSPTTSSQRFQTRNQVSNSLIDIAWNYVVFFD